MQLRRSFGFTLIEIIIVVVILGMMAMFIVPGYTKSVNKTYEKAATNNLTIIYSAQKLKYNGGGAYQTGASTALVNTNLGLGVISNGVTYACTVPTATTFQCTATYGTFTLRVNESYPTTAICCSVGTCPSVAGC